MTKKEAWSIYTPIFVPNTERISAVLSPIHWSVARTTNPNISRAAVQMFTDVHQLMNKKGGQWTTFLDNQNADHKTLIHWQGLLAKISNFELHRRLSLLQCRLQMATEHDRKIMRTYRNFQAATLSMARDLTEQRFVNDADAQRHKFAYGRNAGGRNQRGGRGGHTQGGRVSDPSRVTSGITHGRTQTCPTPWTTLLSRKASWPLLLAWTQKP